MYAHIISGNGIISLVINQKAYTINKEHPNYNNIISNLGEENKDFLLTLVDVRKSLIEGLQNRIDIVGDVLYLNSKPMHNTLSSRILDFMKKQLPYQGLVRLLDNINLNEDPKSVEELYDFLEKTGLPITDNGTFLAYKVVLDNYYSKTSGQEKLIQGKRDKEGRIYNGVGETIEMSRQDVDNNRNNACSKGLHVGGLAYSGVNGSFYDVGDRVVIIEVNPKDAVSVPTDHNCHKLRVCKYRVVADYSENLTAPLYKTEEKSVKEVEKSVPQGKMYGTKPDGTKFYAVRGQGGRFTKKGV